MPEHYDHPDDYNDHSPSPILEMTIYIMARMFVVAGAALILAACAQMGAL